MSAFEFVYEDIDVFVAACVSEQKGFNRRITCLTSRKTAVKGSTYVPAAAAPDCEEFLCRTSDNCWGCWPSVWLSVQRCTTSRIVKCRALAIFQHCHENLEKYCSEPLTFYHFN